jgi:hypothetical protein
MPQIVAYLNSEIIGFILTTSQSCYSNRDVPIVNLCLHRTLELILTLITFMALLR